MKNIFLEIAENIYKRGLVREGDSLVIGLSGGGDSVGLFYALLELKKMMELELIAVHVHHGIRGESADEDQRYVEQLCGKEKIKCYCIKENVPEISKKLGLSIELAGRKVRKEAFERLLRTLKGHPVLMLAHHANDQEETILMNFLRGSGLAGLSGMKQEQRVVCEDGFSYSVVRPFLELEHKDILDGLRLKNITWREDESNSETIYNRNMLRLKILPMIKELYPGFTAVAQRTGKVMNDNANYLAELSESFLADNSYIDNGELFISIKALEKEHIALRREVIRRAVRNNGGLVDVSYAQTAEILSLMNLQSGRQINIDGGRRVRKSFDYLVFGEGNNEKKQFGLAIEFSDEEAEDIIKNKINNASDVYTKWFDYDKIEKLSLGEVVIRVPRDGDYLIIDREGHKKKLSTYLKQQKIDINRRMNIEIAATGNLVLAIEGYRNSLGFEIDSDSKRILKVYSKEN